MGDADLDAGHRGDAVEPAQFERGGSGPRRVVLVRERRTEDREQVGALVAERQLQQIAPVGGQDALRAADEVVELARGGVVGVVVDPAEAHEHGNRRPQLGEELPAPRAHPLEDGRQDPRSQEIGGQRGVRFGERGFRDGPRQAPDDAERAPTLIVEVAPRELDRVRERFERRLVEHDLALLGMLLGGGEPVDEAPGEHVDELDLGIADDESPGGADRHRDLHLDPHRGPAGCDGLAAARDRVLHREAACGCARAVVAVEPAGDPVAAEIDDVATEAIELVSERFEHAIQVGGQHLCSAPWTELGGKGLRERREAGDVGEQGGAADAVGQLPTGSERPPAIARDVRLGVVGGELFAQRQERPS